MGTTCRPHVSFVEFVKKNIPCKRNYVVGRHCCRRWVGGSDWWLVILGGGGESVVKAAKGIMLHLHDSWGDFK